MNSKLGIKRTAITAAFLAAFGASGLAFAIYEAEPNDSLATAQRLEIGSGGRVEVTAAIGNNPITGVNDLDLYVFEGTVDDLVTINIDGGYKGNVVGSVDTTIAIFGPDGRKLDWSDDALSVDSGSLSTLDSRIDNFRVPATGAYVVGVSSFPRDFGDYCCNVIDTPATSNGSYTLLISGVTPPAPPPPAPAPLVMHISIEVKPGTMGASAPINPKSKGNIPVALLGNSQFNVAEVDQQSLRFGPQGTEASPLRCNKGYADVNADGMPDLVCHFDTQTAGFGPSDSRGFVKGSMKEDGRRFEGHAPLKVVPVKRRN